MRGKKIRCGAWNRRAGVGKQRIATGAPPSAHRGSFVGGDSGARPTSGRGPGTRAGPARGIPPSKHVPSSTRTRIRPNVPLRPLLGGPLVRRFRRWNRFCLLLGSRVSVDGSNVKNGCRREGQWQVGAPTRRRRLIPFVLLEGGRASAPLLAVDPVEGSARAVSPRAHCPLAGPEYSKHSTERIEGISPGRWPLPPHLSGRSDRPLLDGASEPRAPSTPLRAGRFLRLLPTIVSPPETDRIRSEPRGGTPAARHFPTQGDPSRSHPTPRTDASFELVCPGPNR